MSLREQGDTKTAANGHQQRCPSKDSSESMLEKGAQELLLQMGKVLERKIKLLLLTS